MRNRLNDIVIQRHRHWEGGNWFVYDAGQIQISYNPDSTLAQTSYNEGLFVNNNAYDGFNLASISYKRSDQSIIGSFQYGYDNNRNMTSRTENGETASFSYDALQRIKTSSLFNESYQYDERGNRKTLSSDLAPTVPLASYAYDDRDRLIQVTSADGQVVQYRYNGDGLLWERTENGVKTRYYYDENGNLFREGIVQADGSVQLTARYIYGGQGFGPAARDDLASGVVLYYMNNGHGDVTGIVDGVGNIVNEYRYDIWGNPLSVSELVNTPFRYSGEYWDDSTGLQYLRARWYDPSVGRFINEDTYEGQIDNPLTLNLYTYVHNNPLIYTDPSGNKVWLIHGTNIMKEENPENTWTDDFVTYVEKLFNESSDKLKWSGGNSKGARSKAAEVFMTKVYEWHKKNPNDPIRLVGHSHGGNVAILVANLLAEKGMKVETLITVATPVREYKLNTVVGQHIQMYNNRDIIQSDMGGRWWLAGFTFTRKFKGADNVNAKDGDTGNSKTSHSSMHSNVDIWKKYIEPILRSKK